MSSRTYSRYDEPPQVATACRIQALDPRRAPMAASVNPWAEAAPQERLDQSSTPLGSDENASDGHVYPQP